MDEVAKGHSYMFLLYALFCVYLVGLLVRVQARAVPGLCRLLHVCSSENTAQPVSPTSQNARRVHLQNKLDHGPRATKPCACHDLPQQGQVCHCNRFLDTTSIMWIDFLPGWPGFCLIVIFLNSVKPIQIFLACL